MRGSAGALWSFRLSILSLSWLAVAPTFAHEVRPAYLELSEQSAGEFRVLWKTPMRGEMRLALSPTFSGRTENLTAVATRLTDTAAVQTWRLSAVDPLRGQSLRIEGLAGTMTDTLVRVEFADGTSWTQLLTPGRPAAPIPVRESRGAVARAYSRLGVEHILRGADHLLFVLALLIIVNGSWRLLQTVTAFTLAHSLTLGLAALGLVHVPAPPVEACIALSIAFVAAEIVRAQRGLSGVTVRAPWSVAFAFGLLHGFGFAGALSEAGLPTAHIPVALLFFNLGVEVGQWIFIAGALGTIAAVGLLRLPRPRWAGLVPAYAIGSVAMFWVIQRLAAY